MGQKVNPHGLRVGVIKNWDSRWFVSKKEFGDTLVSDHKIREYVKTKLQGAGVPRIEIERDASRVRVFIQCAKPGVVIGFHGAEIEKLRAELEAMVGRPVVVNVIEIKNPDVNAQLVSECFVCPGPTLKRVQPRAQGRAFQILKRTSHVTLVVKEKEVG